MLGRRSPSHMLDDPLPSISLDNHTLLYNSNHTLSHHSHSPAPASPPYQLQEFQRSPSHSVLNLPGTPSYAGSYHGSPASNWADADDGVGLYQDQDDYNPSDYDIVDKSGNMYPQDNSPFDLINDNFDFGHPDTSTPTLSIVPAEPMSTGGDIQLAVNHPSPASSAGIPHDRRSPSPMHSRSRASSIASSHGSPRNSVIGQGMGEPQWGVTAPSPPANAPSPHHGSRSPPTLVIPDGGGQTNTHLNVGGSYTVGVSGNADHRGLAPDGPGINLIPATPISGGGNGATSAPFAHTFQRGQSPQRPQRPSSRCPSPVPSTASNPAVDMNMWPAQQTDRNPVSRVPSPAQNPTLPPQFLASGTPAIPDANVLFNGPIPSHPASPFTAPSPSVSPHPSPNLGLLDLTAFSGGDTANQGSLTVPPYMKHQRSKSETYSPAQRPSWALGVPPYHQSTTNLPSAFDIDQPPPNNMQHLSSNVAYMHPSSADPLNPNFPRIDPPQISHVSTFGTSVPNFNVGEMFLDPYPSNRRPRSDAGLGHRRGAKSEDLSHSPFLTAGSLGPGLILDQQFGLLHPPSHASLMVPAEQYGRGGTANGFGHHRRASSGSRSSISAASSARASPYPSPNASPMVGYAELQPDTAGPMAKMEGLNIQEKSSTPILNVARPHVTTSATQAASATRRTSEATFTCPVPGCGSTFTRHFNLKGHLRSHNDERPFRCKWPGCEKGFARQHDCKRHEQLHLNIRPYTCEGCSRTFARMDALNRHLRSEGGAECAKHQQPLTEDRAVKTESKSGELPQQQQWTNTNGARSGSVLT